MRLDKRRDQRRADQSEENEDQQQYYDNENNLEETTLERRKGREGVLCPRKEGESGEGEAEGMNMDAEDMGDSEGNIEREY